jgi:hypothetical protein
MTIVNSARVPPGFLPEMPIIIQRENICAIQHHKANGEHRLR